MCKRINVVVGHFGSGKTEFALNYAIELKKTYERVYIVDLDIVNPYYRTADEKNMLSEKGISLIASPYACSNVDIPALPADVIRVFNDKDAAVVFDVGGDDDGAIALGRYKQFFDEEDYELFFMINTCRPLTKTKEDIIYMISAIEEVSRLKVTALVNNTNLAAETTIDILLKGQSAILCASTIAGIKLKYISGTKEVISLLPDELKDFAFAIKRYILMD